MFPLPCTILTRLCASKAEQVMKPDWPFQHTALMEQGILSTFQSVDAAFMQAYREPCVMFCDQPTLRSGDAAYFMQRWSADEKNMLVAIDPDYGLDDLLAPYQVCASPTIPTRGTCRVEVVAMHVDLGQSRRRSLPRIS